jgi:hypothetical protein
MQEEWVEGFQPKLSQAKRQTLSEKLPKAKRTGGVTQVLEFKFHSSGINAIHKIQKVETTQMFINWSISI